MLHVEQEHKTVDLTDEMYKTYCAVKTESDGPRMDIGADIGGPRTSKFSLSVRLGHLNYNFS